MTAKEYLSQAYRLDKRIDSNIAEITRLREMACGISSPSWEEKVPLATRMRPSCGAWKRSWTLKKWSTMRLTPSLT